MRSQDIVLAVREVHRSFHPLEIPVSVYRIKGYIEDVLKIEFEAFDKAAWPSKFIYGRVHRYEQEGRKWAKIFVSESLNACWTRFVACKELAHLLIDTKDEDCTHDPITLIGGLISPIPTTIEADVKSEWLAHMAAVELLVPWPRRNLITEMIGTGKNNYEIACTFKVPEKIIEWWRSDAYQALAKKAWEGI
jgi:hypothetical protein